MVHYVAWFQIGVPVSCRPKRLPSLRHSFLHASFSPTCLRRTTGGTSSLLVRSVLSFPSTGLLSMHKRAQYIRLTLVVNTNASTTYSPWRVVNMTNGYSKYSDTAIFKIPNVQVNPVRMKIFKNTTAFFALYCLVSCSLCLLGCISDCPYSQHKEYYVE